MTGQAASRLTIYLTIRDRRQGRWLLVELVARARSARMAGATVFRGQAGYGVSGRRHADRLVEEDAPLRFVAIDAPERIDAFLGTIADLVEDSLVVIDDVEVLMGPLAAAAP